AVAVEPSAGMTLLRVHVGRSRNAPEALAGNELDGGGRVDTHDPEHDFGEQTRDEDRPRDEDEIEHDRPEGFHAAAPAAENAATCPRAARSIECSRKTISRQRRPAPSQDAASRMRDAIERASAASSPTGVSGNRSTGTSPRLASTSLASAGIPSANAS